MSIANGRPKPRRSDQILLVDRCLAPELAYEISKMDGLYGIALHEHYGATRQPSRCRTSAS
jgi:hypothetical protein